MMWKAVVGIDSIQFLMSGEAFLVKVDCAAFTTCVEEAEAMIRPL